MTTTDRQVEIAATWFLAARAMAAAGAEPPRPDDASAGLFARGVLGLTEDACLEARKQCTGARTLVDCLSMLRRLPHDATEKIVTGVLMMALSDHRLGPLEIRWASMLTSAAHLDADGFQRCCAAARVMASMLRGASGHGSGGGGGA